MSAVGARGPHPTIIEPPRAWPGIGLRELWQMRRILWVISHRTLQVRYRQTVIGIGWVVFQPLLLTFVLSIFIGLVMGGGEGDGVPYPLFILSALVVWRVITRVVTEGGSSVVTSSSLVSRIYLPRSYLPISVAIVSLSDLLFNCLSLLLMMVIYGFLPGIGLLALPLLLLVAYATALGLALLIGAFGTEYRDVGLIVPVLIQAWFFASPIIYPVSQVPAEYLTLYYLNPAALVIEGFRGAFLQLPMPPLEGWIAGSGMAALLFVTGYVAFRRREPFFADVL